MSCIYGDDNSDIVDQNAVISRVLGVLDSIQLQQVSGITEKMSRMMNTAAYDLSSNVATNIRQQIELNRQKARKKSTLTKARRTMLILLGEDLQSRREIRS